MGLPFVAGSTSDQAPFALVLSCSDARVPIESLFDRGFNDLFVVRIAGNVLGTECLGSFDYAVRHLKESLKAVVVLGHTHCGAVTAAVDAYLHPNDYADIAFTHALRSLVNRILSAVRGAAHAFERQCGHEISRHPGFRAVLVEAAVYLNAAITAFDLQGRDRQAGGSDLLQVFYGVQHLHDAGPIHSRRSDRPAITLATCSHIDQRSDALGRPNRPSDLRRGAS